MKPSTTSRLWVLIAACVGILAVPGCSADGDALLPPRNPDLTVDSRLVAAMNDFGFRLHKELAKADGDGNTFISPASIELALAMTYNGAEGTTKEAMAAALGTEMMSLDEVNQANAQLMTLLQNPDPKVQLAIANSLWGRKGFTFNEDFLERNTGYYQAQVQAIDFLSPTSADTINQWVREQTREKISKLVDHNAIRDALLLLINAIYFKGKWTEPFDKAQTQEGEFTLNDGTSRMLPMMRQTGKFDYLETERLQAIAIPYGDEYVRMLILLPKKEISLGDFIAGLTHENWVNWTKRLHKREGTIVLPRFKAGYAASLKRSLTALGMGVAFTGDADLSGMLPAGGEVSIEGKPFISDVVHKTVLEVNEEGTEAAAATGVVVGVTSVPSEPPFTMVVDHPFFVAIEDRPTGAILFMGLIANPELDR